jgi:hypothetical protein
MNHSDTKQILQKRFDKLSKHYEALRDYKSLINKLLIEKDIYEQFIFNTLKPEKKAILDAYPEELKEALIDLKFCIDSFEKIESYYLNSLNFAIKYIK